MSLVYIILVIAVVGILVWLINTYVTIIDPKFKQLINIVAIVGIIIWLLWVLGIWQKLGSVNVPRVQTPAKDGQIASMCLC